VSVHGLCVWCLYVCVVCVWRVCVVCVCAHACREQKHFSCYVPKLHVKLNRYNTKSVNGGDCC